MRRSASNTPQAVQGTTVEVNAQVRKLDVGLNIVDAVGELVHTKRNGQRITVLARKTLDRDREGTPGRCWKTSRTSPRAESWKIPSPRAPRIWRGPIAVAAEFLPEVVLLDIGPPGMDGFDEAQAITHSTGAKAALSKMNCSAISTWRKSSDASAMKICGS
jgi:CheY-like chemotaxis protein